MANFIDTFAFVLHNTLEGLEQELVQTVKERALREGSAFPGEVNRIEATIEVDLNAVLKSSASCRTVQQVQSPPTKGGSSRQG